MLIHLLHLYSHGHWLLSATTLRVSPGHKHTHARIQTHTHTHTHTHMHTTAALVSLFKQTAPFCISERGADQITWRGLCMMWWGGGKVDFVEIKINSAVGRQSSSVALFHSFFLCCFLCSVETSEKTYCSWSVELTVHSHAPRKVPSLSCEATVPTLVRLCA